MAWHMITVPNIHQKMALQFNSYKIMWACDMLVITKEGRNFCVPHKESRHRGGVSRGQIRPLPGTAMPRHQLVGGFCPPLLTTGSTGLPLTLVQPASPLFQPLHCVYSRARLLPPPSGSLFLITSVRRGFPTPCASVGAAQLASRLVVLEKAIRRLELFLLLS